MSAEKLQDDFADMTLDEQAGGCVYAIVKNDCLPHTAVDIHLLADNVRRCVAPELLAQQGADTLVIYGMLRAIRLAHDFPELFNWHS